MLGFLSIYIHYRERDEVSRILSEGKNVYITFSTYIHYELVFK